MPVTPRVTNAHRLPLLSTCCEWRLFWQPSDREHDEWVADYNDYRFIPQGHRGLGSPHFPACHRHSPPEEVNKSGIRASASGALLQRG